MFFLLANFILCINEESFSLSYKCISRQMLQKLCLQIGLISGRVKIITIKAQGVPKYNNVAYAKHKEEEEITA